MCSLHLLATPRATLLASPTDHTVPPHLRTSRLQYSHHSSHRPPLQVDAFGGDEARAMAAKQQQLEGLMRAKQAMLEAAAIPATPLMDAQQLREAAGRMAPPLQLAETAGAVKAAEYGALKAAIERVTGMANAKEELVEAASAARALTAGASLEMFGRRAPPHISNSHSWCDARIAGVTESD